MPTYEYQCTKCKHEFEKFQSIKDKPLQRCPQCRGKIKRLIGTGAGIIFKGSGFYSTDYRSESYKSGVKAEKEHSEKSSAKKEEKSSAASSPAAKTTEKKKT